MSERIKLPVPRPAFIRPDQSTRRFEGDPKRSPIVLHDIMFCNAMHASYKSYAMSTSPSDRGDGNPSPMILGGCVGSETVAGTDGPSAPLKVSTKVGSSVYGDVVRSC